MKINRITVDYADAPLGIDEKPSFCWEIESEEADTLQTGYAISVADGKGEVWREERETDRSTHIPYCGVLKPRTRYTITVKIRDNHGNEAEGSTTFETGKADEAWTAKWIQANTKIDDDASVPPYIFQKSFELKKKPVSARIYSTALGCYSLGINGLRATDEYFAPGYTQYTSYVQYNTYDVTEQLKVGKNVISAEITGGWYAGRLGLYRNANHFGKHRALCLELHVLFEDDTEEIIITDGSWQYTSDGCRRFANFFDGEIFDANRKADDFVWHSAVERDKSIKIVPNIGVPVRRHEKIPSVKLSEKLYDFGKNFAGIVHIGLTAKKGARIKVRHAEILYQGELYTKSLRTAKAELTYIASEGSQEYEPLFTFMGFRYAEITVEGEAEITDVYGYALYSDMELTGEFSCSDEYVTRLQQNILTSQKANFIDIPTDCPQRDERCGWTGDIAAFAPTAAYNMNVNRFLNKWLRDVKAAQLRRGSIPVIVPDNNILYTRLLYEAVWGDCVILVPWALYRSSGDVSVLARQYDSMKKWLRFVEKTCAKFSFGDRKYIWSGFHIYGDWLAPDCSVFAGMRRGKWTSTAYFANSAAIMKRTAELLGKEEDARYYEGLYEKIKKAFNRVFVEDGHIKKGFQSIYVLALRFGLLDGKTAENALADLVENIEKNGNHLTTGFVGTTGLPYALSDNGRADKAYDLLYQDTCPSWLYTVKAGGTSIWERWDGLLPDGTIKLSDGVGNMTSFNHYAYGSVGEWLYKRVAGIEEIEPGYKTFRIKPIMGRNMTFVKASYKSLFGKIAVEWKIEGGRFLLDATVPANTRCEVVLPDGKSFSVGSGTYHFETKA